MRNDKMTICIFQLRRIACFRPDVLPVGKNEMENAYVIHSQSDSEILTNQPAWENAGSAVHGRSVFRMRASVARNTTVYHEKH